LDRFLVWLGAGVVTAGMSAAMLAGAGVASADNASGSDTEGTTSSESAKPPEKQTGFGHRRRTRGQAEAHWRKVEEGRADRLPGRR
jgi:hypothetical protein